MSTFIGVMEFRLCDAPPHLLVGWGAGWSFTFPNPLDACGPSTIP